MARLIQMMRRFFGYSKPKTREEIVDEVVYMLQSRGDWELAARLAKIASAPSVSVAARSYVSNEPS